MDDAKAYRDDLLKVGIGIEITPEDGHRIRQIASKSRGNPASSVHQVNAENVLACGVVVPSENKKWQRLLVLPRSKEAFEAAIDFLRFKVMSSTTTKTAPAADLVSLGKIADNLEALGVKAKLLEKLQFKNGTTAISMSDGEYETVTDGHRARVIGTWAVHKPVKDTKGFRVVSRNKTTEHGTVSAGKGFRVTHTKVGRAAAGGLSKKAAMDLAKALAGASYPWRLIVKSEDVMLPEWAASSEFARAAIARARQPKVLETTSNPSGQLRLF